MQSPTAALEEAQKRPEAGARRAESHRGWKRNMSVHCVMSDPVRALSLVFLSRVSSRRCRALFREFLQVSCLDTPLRARSCASNCISNRTSSRTAVSLPVRAGLPVHKIQERVRRLRVKAAAMLSFLDGLTLAIDPALAAECRRVAVEEVNARGWREPRQVGSCSCCVVYPDTCAQQSHTRRNLARQHDNLRLSCSGTARQPRLPHLLRLIHPSQTETPALRVDEAFCVGFERTDGLHPSEVDKAKFRTAFGGATSARVDTPHHTCCGLDAVRCSSHSIIERGAPWTVGL